ncbi:MAG: copper chaperone PCu(A)C [Gammaproteobacteria bacterium]|nr:copper chaperone PCu(A)C [Gammaproteobacteria bacterium]
MHRLITFAAALLLSPALLAQHYEHGDIHVMDPWSRALPPVASNGAAYLQLNNRGGVPDRLVGASSPAAERVEIHTHTMDGGMMKMRRVESVDLPPGEYVTFEPGALHLMLFGLKQPFVEGETYPVTLQFDHAEPVEVTVTVRPVDAGTSSGHAHGTHGSHENKKQ